MSASLSMLTLGVQDGDDQVVGSDTEIKLLLEGVEMPGAFDAVDQFSGNQIQGFVSHAGVVTLPVPRNLIRVIRDGAVEVSIQILQLGTAPSTDAIGIDFSDFNVTVCGPS